MRIRKRRIGPITEMTLNEELQALDAKIVQLGIMSDDALEKALVALEMRDYSKASMVIAADHTIDSMRKAIEEHAIRLLARQQPLSGQQLRYLMSALMIAGNLERIG